ncbi:MAG: OmpA family protein [Saprospiraceae bacterium]|nr:OmpA family protein [Saprospiraceae bacterium]
MKYSVFALFFLLLACTYTQKIKDGTTAYERKQFDVAKGMLQKEYQRESDRIEKGKKAYMLAESHRRTNDPASAVDWYNKAINDGYRGDASIKYAQMLQQVQRYDEASRAYQSAGQAEGDRNKYYEYRQACNQAKEWLAEADSNEYKVDNLKFNNGSTDFLPIIFDENQLLITSDRTESEGNDIYKWTGEKYFDLFLLNKEANTLERYEVPFNTDYHQSAIVFNQDKTEAYFTQCGSDDKAAVNYCKIMHTKKQGGTWSQPKEVKLGGADYNYMHPHLSADGKLLFFVSNNQAGYGGYDLYYSVWVTAEERWGAPKNMGSKVNTQGNEVFPYLDADTLYFSSDGHPGMGGLDLFRVEQSAHLWGNLQNLKAPMNSGSDDFGLVIDSKAKIEDENTFQIGYFSSNRLEGKGGDDIYRFERAYPKPEPEPPLPDTPTIVFNLRLDGKVKERIYNIEGDPNSGLKELKDLPAATLRISTEDTVFTLGAELDGSFTTTLDTGKVYTVEASKTNYFKQSKTLSTKGIVLTEEEPEKVLEIQLELDQIYKGREIVLEGIYYDYDSDKIREDAAVILDSLVNILTKNPDLAIQLSSHTDCRGKDSYNQDLSQRRAESAVRYLTQKGVLSDRLSARGYGESKLAEDCRCSQCSEEEHQANRRTTFMVLE